jgi:hypothetical protein
VNNVVDTNRRGFKRRHIDDLNMTGTSTMLSVNTDGSATGELIENVECKIESYHHHHMKRHQMCEPNSLMGHHRPNTDGMNSQRLIKIDREADVILTRAKIEDDRVIMSSHEILDDTDDSDIEIIGDSVHHPHHHLHHRHNEMVAEIVDLTAEDHSQPLNEDENESNQATIASTAPFSSSSTSPTPSICLLNNISPTSTTGAAMNDDSTTSSTLSSNQYDCQPTPSQQQDTEMHHRFVHNQDLSMRPQITHRTRRPNESAQLASSMSSRPVMPSSFIQSAPRSDYSVWFQRMNVSSLI